MGNGVNVLAGLAAEQLEDRLHIDAGRGKQAVGQGQTGGEFDGLELGLLSLGLGGTGNDAIDTDDLADQRVAVGVHAGGRQADDDVALTHVGGVDHLGAIDNTHGEAGQVVVVRTHDAGVLGHLAAHKRATRKLAAVGHALDDLGHVLGLDMANGDVIEEEQRLGAGGEDVVHAHGDEILADRLVTVEDLSEHELGAHAVGAGDEDRVLHVLERGGGEQAAEATDAADDLGAVGLLDHLLDRVDRAAALGGIDAGVLVRYVLALGHVRFLSTQGIPSTA